MYQAEPWNVSGSLQDGPDDVMSNHSQQAEADQQKRSHDNKNQITRQGLGSKQVPRSDECREQNNPCDRCRPLLAQQDPEKDQHKQSRKPQNWRPEQETRYISNDGTRAQKLPLWA